MAHSGFHRILIVNGHGGNNAVQQFALEWAADYPGCRVLFHNWWNAPRTWAKVQAIDPVASHGSWMENFPWTRLPGVEMPGAQRPMVDLARVRALDPSRSVSISATAISVGCISARTTRCSHCGRSRWTRHAPC